MPGTKKILVAEDSSVIQNITRKVLQFQNYQIVSVKNGKQVLEELEKDNFSALLLDINMPVMDGMECARKIRQLKDLQKSRIPIIAISGNPKNYTMADFKAAGIDEFLPKPLNFDNLVNAVNKATS